MSIAAPIQSRFDGGEISPLLYGRVDAERYKASVALCKNIIPTLQGAAVRRSGTTYLGDGGFAGRLVPFIYSTTQAYVLEFGHLYIRFWANYGQVLDEDDEIYQIATGYPTASLSKLSFTQSADVLYITHPTYHPNKLLRYAPDEWELVPLNKKDGPYFGVPVSNPTYVNVATASALTGTITLSTVAFVVDGAVSGAVNNGAGLVRLTIGSTKYLETGSYYFIDSVTGTTEANGLFRIRVISATTIDLLNSVFVNAYVTAGQVSPAPFVSTDQGRLIRLQSAATWSWGIITGYTSPRVIAVLLRTDLASVNVTAYMLGAWSTTTGYPAACCFHQDRLCFSGPTIMPQRIDGSRTGDYENFAPTAPDGTVTASHAFSFDLNANDVNAISWMSSDERGLLAGSVSSEWSLRASAAQAALSPLNVNAGQTTKWGSVLSSFVVPDIQVASTQVGKAAMFIQRGARKLREVHYHFDVDGYRSIDLTELAEHITESGVFTMAYQAIPVQTLWLVRNDGVLIGMSYERDQLQLRVGWHQHVLGGVSDPTGNPPIIRSIAVIPDPTGVQDDLWMLVSRYVNGEFVQYVEYLNQVFDDATLPEDAMLLDSASTYDAPFEIYTISNANPAVVTTVEDHGFSNGDEVIMRDIYGMTELNGNVYTIAGVTVDTFQLVGVNSTAFGAAYFSPGNVRRRVLTISGLDYLNGETVSILADGAVHPVRTVSSGAITLDYRVATVQVGYPYFSDLKLLRQIDGARNGTALAKTRRMHRVGVMVHRSQGLQMGPSFEKLDPILFRTQNVDLDGRATTLFSGIVSQNVEFDYDFDNQLCLRVSEPLPCTIQAIMPMHDVQDRQ